MSTLLIFAFLFFLGSHFGWCLEVIFRRFFSRANPERKWINPGFCVGPYVPLYGVGLCGLYALAILGEAFGLTSSVWKRTLLFTVMAACMTAIEYLSGLLALKWLKVRLWDYREERWNVDGLICPKFSFFWALLSAGYYFLIHPHILDGLRWLAENLAFSFFIGFFYGVFCIDVVYSSNLIAKMKQFAEENDAVVRVERVRRYIRQAEAEAKQKERFLFSFVASRSLTDYLKEAHDALEKRLRKDPGHN